MSSWDDGRERLLRGYAPGPTVSAVSGEVEAGGTDTASEGPRPEGVGSHPSGEST